MIGTTRSIRFRITAAAAIVAAVVLTAAGAMLIVLQRRALTDIIDAALAQRADGIVALLDEGSLEWDLGDGSDDQFVQFVARDGTVSDSTANLASADPLDITIEAGGGATLRTVDDVPVDDDPFRVLSRPVDGGVLHVGSSFDRVAESGATLAGSLAATIPVVVAVFAALVWWLVGRTLGPVEDIREQVDSISADRLDRRVPRPGTDDEIDRLAVTMNAMLDRLQAATERQQRFVADASHELRGPLTRLRGELELAVRTPATADRERLESLHREVVSMQAMVDDLLYLARADTGAAVARTTSVDLDDLVLIEGRHVAVSHGVEIDLSGVSGACVEGNRAQLTRAIGNVMDNAGRHARARVSVTLHERADRAVLVVHDDGPGVPAEAAERIFQRFGRADEARSAERGGAGLGLAIAHEIIEQHGGDLVLTNPGVEGATFELTLPATRV